jgi:serine/threonine protein kinase/WD40 repeat protein
VLAAYALGELHQTALEDVAQHVEDCPTCEVVLQELECLSDPVIAGLRRALPSTTPSPATSLSGRLGDYQVLREVGRGGMGVVYEAIQLSLGRRVALKVLLSYPLLDARWVERFRREARAAGRLHHTNIVPVYGTGEEGGMHYIAMQFIPGAGLDAILRRLRQLAPGSSIGAGDSSPPSGTCTSLAASMQALLGSAPIAHSREPCADEKPQEDRLLHFPICDLQSAIYNRKMVWLGIQAAEALDYAHSQGVVHRDVKPSNLLLDADGALWVSDFGLAKGAADPDDLTHTGDLVGTLRYAAPERFAGKCDARTDVHGLGLTLYELLTLRPAFPETDRSKLLEQVLRSEPPRPRRLVPSLPRDLETIVLKAIARDPAQRYATARDLADDLRRFLDDLPIRARRATWAERLWRWGRREPVTAGLLAGLVLVFLAGFVGVLSQWLRAESKAAAEVEARQVAERAEGQARTNLYFSLVAQARLEAQMNNTPAADLLLGRCEPDARGWEWHYLSGVNHTDLLTLDHESLINTSGLAFSPDGTLLACARWTPYLKKGEPPPADAVEVWDLRTQRRVCRLPGSPNETRVAFSPDGRFLAVSGPHMPSRLWEADGWRLHRTGAPADEMVFRPDGKQLASIDLEAVTILDASTGAVLQRYPSQPGRIAFRPDGKQLAVAGSQALELRDASSGRPFRRLTYGTVVVSERFPELAFSPDGKFLVVATTPPTVWDLATGQLANRLVGHTGAVVGVAFTPDARSIVTAGIDSTVRLWDAQTGAERTILRGHRGRVGCVSVHPDGWCLASGGRRSGDVKVWDLTQPPEHLVLRGVNASALMLEAGGTRLRSVGATGWLEAWHAHNRRLLHSSPTDMTAQWLTPATLATFSSDRRRLAVVSNRPDAIQVLDATTGKEQRVLRGLSVPAAQVAISADGGRVAAAGIRPQKPVFAREVRVWDAATGESLFEVQPRSDPMPRLLGAIALSPDGARVAFDDYAPEEADARGAPRTRVKVSEVAGRKELLDLPCLDLPLFCLAFSADGKRLAAGDMAGRVVVWGPDGERLHEAPSRARAGNWPSAPMAGAWPAWTASRSRSGMCPAGKTSCYCAEPARARATGDSTLRWPGARMVGSWRQPTGTGA